MADLIHYRFAAPRARMEPTLLFSEPGRAMFLGCLDAALSSAWLVRNKVASKGGVPPLRALALGSLKSIQKKR